MDLRQYIEHFDHYDQTVADNYHDVFSLLRSECPVARSDQYGGFWSITSYADVRTVQQDWELFTSQLLVIPEPPGGITYPIAMTDPPLHTSYRALLQPSLSLASMLRHEDSIRAHANELIDRFIDAGTCDIAIEFAYQLPADVIADLMGVPRQDAEFFRECSNRINNTSASDPQGAVKGFEEMFAYYGALLQSRRDNPQDDIPTVIANAADHGVELSAQEEIMMCLIIHLAGFDTTACFFGSAIHHLAMHPELRRRLIDEPTIIPRAVEEFLRMFSSANPGRKVARDTVLGGQELKAGDRLVLWLGSANRDADQFPDPHTADFDRHPNKHVAFGQGIHRCIGMHLARLEGRIMLEVLLNRIPDFEVAEGTAPVYAVGHDWGVRSLQITFGGAR